MVEGHYNVDLLVLERGADPVERHYPVVLEVQHVLRFLDYRLYRILVCPRREREDLNRDLKFVGSGSGSAGSVMFVMLAGRVMLFCS